MGDLHLLRPWWLLGLLPAFAIWWLIWRQQKLGERWQRAIDPRLLPHLMMKQGNTRPVSPMRVLPVLWILTVLILAGPTWKLQPSPFGADSALIIVLKTSSTMSTTDVQPSRLERAKHKIADLLAMRKGKSAGLIVYSGSAHMVMPPTQDDRVISEMLSELDEQVMPSDGDVLDDALQLASDMITRAGLAGSVLVIADTVSPDQAAAISQRNDSLPVQFLAVQRTGATIDQGLQQAASGLSASIDALSVDAQDVERIVRREQSLPDTSGAVSGSQRWQEAGYFLLPLLGLLALFWSRKGWRLA